MSSTALPSAVFPPISFCVAPDSDSHRRVAGGGVRVNLVQVGKNEVDADLVVHDEVVDNFVLAAANNMEIPAWSFSVATLPWNTLLVERTSITRKPLPLFLVAVTLDHF